MSALLNSDLYRMQLRILHLRFFNLSLTPTSCYVACVELGLKTADLLKLFNSRACQLVLGAGAVSMAGLKTITIRSPLVTVVLSFLPVLRIRIHMFLGLLDPDPDPSVRGMSPDPDLDPSITKQKK
jgi:hypothetical protein